MTMDWVIDDLVAATEHEASWEGDNKTGWRHKWGGSTWGVHSCSDK